MTDPTAYMYIKSHVGWVFLPRSLPCVSDDTKLLALLCLYSPYRVRVYKAFRSTIVFLP